MASHYYFVCSRITIGICNFHGGFLYLHLELQFTNFDCFVYQLFSCIDILILSFVLCNQNNIMARYISMTKQFIYLCLFKDQRLLYLEYNDNFLARTLSLGGMPSIFQPFPSLFLLYPNQLFQSIEVAQLPHRCKLKDIQIETAI